MPERQDLYLKHSYGFMRVGYGWFENGELVSWKLEDPNDSNDKPEDNATIRLLADHMNGWILGYLQGAVAVAELVTYGKTARDLSENEMGSDAITHGFTLLDSLVKGDWDPIGIGAFAEDPDPATLPIAPNHDMAARWVLRANDLSVRV